MPSNPITTRPATGWTDETVPIEIGRKYWIWIDGQRDVWKSRCDGLRDLVADWNDPMQAPITHWQYSDVLDRPTDMTPDQP